MRNNFSQTKGIIFINYSKYISGSEFSLKQIVEEINPSVKKQIITGNISLFINQEKLALEVNQKLSSWFNDVISSIKYISTNKPDILYFNNLKSLMFLFPLVLFFFRKKIILHIRDNIKFKLLQNILCFFTDKIICNSKFIHNQLFFKNKATVIYNGVDTGVFKPFKKNNYKNERIIACVSQITAWKRIEDFIEIANLIIPHYPRIVFRIIGDVLNPKDQIYKTELENLVKKYNLQDEIKFIGFQKNIESHISKIDILCHTAVEEPFGRVLIEAMSCAKPIIAYSSGGPLEIVNSEVGFLIPERDIVSFSKKIEKLLCDKQLILKMGKKGREHVLQNFSINKHVKQIENLLL